MLSAGLKDVGITNLNASRPLPKPLVDCLLCPNDGHGTEMIWSLLLVQKSLPTLTGGVTVLPPPLVGVTDTVAAAGLDAPAEFEALAL